MSSDDDRAVGSGWVGGDTCWRQLAGVTVCSRFISGCPVRERPAPGQKHRGESLSEHVDFNESL